MNAAKRLQDRLFQDYEGLPLLLLEDALYANEPHLEQILAHGWDFITNVKPTSHKALFTLFQSRQARGQINTLVVDEDKIQHHFYWMNNVPVNGQGNLRVNFLYYEERNRKGKAKTFSWVTSIKLRKSNVVMALLMLLSFLIDQIVQACSKGLKSIWKEAKAKNRVWKHIRALFMIQPINSFNELFDALERIFIPKLE